MKKLVIKLVALAVLVVVAVVVAGAFYIDSIARKGIESGSTYALGVPTTLSKADVGLLSGTFSMAGLDVANPKGDFSSPQFLALGEGQVAVSLNSLRGETVELPLLTLSDVSMSLERQGNLSNYKVILDNLKRFESGEKPAEPAGPSKRFIIRKLELRNINVHIDLIPEGGKLTQVDVPIDLIELKDVGSDTSKGMLLSDLAGVILKTIITVAVNKGGDLIPGDISGELTKGLGELQNLGDQGITVLLGDGGVVETIGKSAEDIGKQAEEGVKKVGEEAKKIGEGIGNIFGKEKDDK